MSWSKWVLEDKKLTFFTVEMADMCIIQVRLSHFKTVLWRLKRDSGQMFSNKTKKVTFEMNITW